MLWLALATPLKLLVRISNNNVPTWSPVLPDGVDCSLDHFLSICSNVVPCFSVSYWFLLFSQGFVLGLNTDVLAERPSTFSGFKYHLYWRPKFIFSTSLSWTREFSNHLFDILIWISNKHLHLNVSQTIPSFVRDLLLVSLSVATPSLSLLQLQIS